MEQDPRTRIRLALGQYLSENAARRVERSCYNETVRETYRDNVSRNFECHEFLSRYAAHASRILYNMSIGPKVVERIEGDSTYATSIAAQSDIEILPEPTQRIRAEIESRRAIKLEQKIMTQYVCPRCKGRRNVRKEYQGASSDEISRFVIVCLDCPS